MTQSKITRRTALKTSAAAAFAFSIVPSHVFGQKNGAVAPSDKLVRGIIGCGGIANGLHFKAPGQIAAVCDVDSGRLSRATSKLTKKFKTKVDGYHDFREMIARPDIDIISVATPPHWHALHAIAAAEAGKDVWCEKPMSRTIGEGIKMVEACERNGTIFRINTWFRLRSGFYGAGVTVKEIKKLVDSKILGWPLKVVIGGTTGFNWKISRWSGKKDLPKQEVPKELDYDFWLGPAPEKDYSKHRTHMSFRGYWDYDGGGLGDMGMHYIDPVQYYLGKDGTSPIKVEVDTDDQDSDAVTAWRKITYTYADGCQIILDGDNSMKGAAYIEGPNGKVFRGMKSTIKNLRSFMSTLPEPAPLLGANGQKDFYKAVITRKKFGLNEINAHRSTTIVNMGKIAVRLNRNLNYDPVKQRFINDDEANRLVNQPMRGPWTLSGGIE